MILFLGFRPALLVIVTIPIAILFALGGVDFTGYGLQQMSIVGLVIALGLLVDDAIVVVENIGRMRREGLAPVEAANRGTSEVAWPSVSGTVTTILAFLPMVAISSATGDYIRSLPVTVIYALAASLFPSLTLTPMMATRVPEQVDRPDTPASVRARRGRLRRMLERMASGPYRRLITGALRRPWRVVAVGFGTLAVALSLFPLVGVSLFPKAEKPQFLVNIETPDGTDLEATDRVVRFVESLLDGREEVVRHAANTGADNPQVYYNLQPRQPRSNVGQVLVELDDYRSAAVVVPALEAEFARYPGARVTVTEFENGPPVEAPIVYKVIGPELETLKELAARVETVLRQNPSARNVRNPLGVRKSDLQVSIDRDRLALLGLDPLTVDRTVRAGLAGLEVGSFRESSGEDSDIVVRLPFARATPTPTDLERITLHNAAGAAIPLAQVASLRLTPGTGRIDHYDTERVATVTAYPTGDATVLDVTRAVNAELEALDWPGGYRWFAGGTFEAQQEGFAGMIRALMVAVLGIFAVLVLQFRSFVQPFVIFASVPLALIGAVLALLVTGYTFSFTAFIGITSLVGIVINNSIVLVDYANRRVAAGDEVAEALRKAGETRFQPIVLTTITTVSGLLPLTLTGSTMWSPLGWTIIGGLMTSTLLTLVMVPALYSLSARIAPPAV
jgi:multidrug efflux pump subunit AcrB